MALFKKKPAQELSIKDIQLPEHIGIIMDGNGRWAKKRGLPRSAGHTAGAQTFRKIARYCSDIGIKYLTVYAFSTENWRRPSDEVDALMRLFKDYLQEAIRDFKDDSIVLRFLGERTAFSPELLSLMNEKVEYGKKLVEITKNEGEDGKKFYSPDGTITLATFMNKLEEARVAVDSQKP